ASGTFLAASTAAAAAPRLATGIAGKTLLWIESCQEAGPVASGESGPNASRPIAIDTTPTSTASTRSDIPRAVSQMALARAIPQIPVTTNSAIITQPKDRKSVV